MPGASLIVASNRGPVSFDDDGSTRRGVGGLVSVLTDGLASRDATWISAAMTPQDRAHTGIVPPAQSGLASASVRMIDIPEQTYDAYYNRMSNGVLWFLHHYLFDPPRSPVFGPADDDAWDAFADVNRRFAEAIAAEAADGASVVVQDYHLSLVPPLLRKLRPDVRIAHFWHIPFVQPDYMRMLPDEWSTALLEGLIGADLIGFQTTRWASAFLLDCRELLGARTTSQSVARDDHKARVGVYPVGVDPDRLRAAAGSADVRRERSLLEKWAAGRRIVLRVDRTELSKNILRGLLAFETLLERRPDLRSSVAHLALLSPSRHDVPEYRAYTDECAAVAERINARFDGAIRLEIEDNFTRTLAAYGLYDVLVVNPVFDGMNLVAYEGPILNKRDGLLVLSHNAGAWTGLGAAAIGVSPFSVTGTASAIEAALDALPEERHDRSQKLRRLARRSAPSRWLDAQLRDLSR